MSYERIMRGDSWYQVTYGPRVIYVVALTGIAWTSKRYTHTYNIPVSILRPAAEWQAHIRESS